MSPGPLQVHVERKVCLRSHGCVRRAPGSFALDADGKALALDQPTDPEGQILNAARACPSFAIHVTRDGEQLV